MKGYAAFARYYDQLTASVDYRSRARHFGDLIRQNNPDTHLILDLACGTGSLSLELAALGFDVIGADSSGEMLSVALQKASGTPYDILWLRQAMESLDLYGTVDAVVCALDSINHLPDEEALYRTLDRIALFLHPGGLLVFDVNTAHKHRHILANNTFVYDLPDIYCVWQNTLRAPHHTVDISLDFFGRTGKDSYIRSHTAFRERIFAPALLEDALARRGFVLTGVYGEDSHDPPGETAQRVVYAARLEKG